jgi:hypothetical protein
MHQDATRPGQLREVTAELVLGLVSAFSGIGRDVLLGPGTARVVSRARRTAMFLLRTEAGLSARQVGQLFGRSAATVRDLSRGVAHDELMPHITRFLATIGSVCLGLHVSGHDPCNPPAEARRRYMLRGMPGYVARCRLGASAMDRRSRARRWKGRALRRSVRRSLALLGATGCGLAGPARQEA